MDVVVVGGGVIGLACAWRLAQRGLEVTVVDPSPGAGASRAAAGMLAPVSELHPGEEPLVALGLAAAARYPDFVAELEQASGRTAGYRATGTLIVALDAGDEAELTALGDHQRRLGLDVERLTRRQARALEPMLAPGVGGGLLVRGDHQVDNRRLTTALLAAVEKTGTRIVTDRVTEVTSAAGVVTGVRLQHGGELAAPTVVLAAGCRCGQIGGVPDDALAPVRPVKGQTLRLLVPVALRPMLRHTVRGTVHGTPVYLVPRADGELVVGATQEERGFDETVTAGGVYQLLRDAHALVPGVTELELVEAVAGLRPASPDNAPMVGRTGLPGLVAATGHSRNGVLLTPVTADAVAALVADGVLPKLMEPFSPLRFAAPEHAQEPAWTSS